MVTGDFQYFFMKNMLGPVIRIVHGSYKGHREIRENISEIPSIPLLIESTYRVATVREKYLENEIFSRSEKSGNFVNGQGNLERTLKVRGKSGNLKWLCQADLENLFILFKEGKRCTFS